MDRYGLRPCGKIIGAGFLQPFEFLNMLDQTDYEAWIKRSGCRSGRRSLAASQVQETHISSPVVDPIVGV